MKIKDCENAAKFAKEWFKVNEVEDVDLNDILEIEFIEKIENDLTFVDDQSGTRLYISENDIDSFLKNEPVNVYTRTNELYIQKYNLAYILDQEMYARYWDKMKQLKVIPALEV